MNRGEASAPRGATSRADLLRALAVADRDQLALDIDASSWFGYVRRAEEAPRPSEIGSLTAPRVPAAAAPPTARKLPLRLPFLHLIVQREARRPPEAGREAEAAAAHAEPLDEDSARAPSDRRLIGYEDLVPEARLLPALRRALGATRAGPLDLERLTHHLATRSLPRHVPRRRQQRWHPQLVVLLDFCPRLWPYREDMHRLAERLLRHCGCSGVSLRIVNDGPLGPWSDWLAHQNQTRAEPPLLPWTMPAVGTPVLIVSDLGLFLGAGSAPCEDWARFIATLVRAEVRPLALAPLGARQLDASLGAALPILRWSPDARARPARAYGPGQPEPEGLYDLLAMVAATRRVDPPLLRALRRLNPDAPLDAGLEGALWCHADVEAGFTAVIRRDAQETHLRRFDEYLPRLHTEARRLRWLHHAHLRKVLNHEETLLWSDDSKETEAAEHFMLRLAATLAEPGKGQFAGNWWAVAQGIVDRADSAMGLRHSAVLHPLLAALVRALGDATKVPAWADPAVLRGVLHDMQGPTGAWLVRDPPSGCLLLQAGPPRARQSPLGERLLLDVGGARVSVGEGAGATTRWLSAAALPLPLCRLSEPTLVQIVTACEILTVAAVSRPRGALGWGCDRTGIAVQTAAVGPYAMKWSSDALRIAPVPGAASSAWGLEAEVPVPLMSPMDEASVRFGIDSPFGVYADLTVTTRHGSATQRLRWMEPGTFLMGSPGDEPKRFGNEGRRHTVTLTRGLWLADSACTQRMWRAVMGTNPSRSTWDEERPVEQVSWDDVQGFLRKLETLLRGCIAGLPTEAEWEYACRVGSDTPFSFGANITPETVNYDGKYPYGGGQKGLYRQQTVPVKSLPPNNWGLYEMHGNVWEWCADGLRAYSDQEEVDPAGPVDAEAHRAVRGGSWGDSAWRARSAYRGAVGPGLAYGGLGFRLCLRSIEPGQGRPGGPAGLAPGGRG